MFENLTLQQFCALDYSRNMVVTSGPGAGKTGILSKRFCFILLTDQSVSVPQILTLTFTEKAAEEMKGRIYMMISRLERELETGIDDNIIFKLRDAREQFNKNRISTIHSFCANLLRENPVESNIDPGFTILQGARQNDIMEESVESAISSIWRKDKDLLLLLFRSFGNRRGLVSAVKNIISHPMAFEHAFKTAGRLFKTEGWTDKVFRDYCRIIRDDYIIPYYNGLKDIEKGKGQYDELMNLLEDWRLKQGTDQGYLGIPELFAAMRRLVDDKKAYGASLSVEEGLKKISYAGLIEEYYPDIFREKSPDRIFEQEFHAFIEVARSCLEHYRNEKRKINSLDFADLETECRSFLAHLALNDRTQLKRIQKKFKYIMVDEFQDTNMVQWEIIRQLCSLAGSAETEGLQPGKLFVVGDKRQAIYRFRGGDITVFERVTEEIKASNHNMSDAFFWQKGGMDSLLAFIDRRYQKFKRTHSDSFDSLSDYEKQRMFSGNIYLSHNFRTDAGPIDFFNRTFMGIFNNKEAGKHERYETPHAMITMPEEKKMSDKAKGSAGFYLIPPSDGKKDSAEKEASLIAEIIEGILGRRGVENNDYSAFKDIRDKINNRQKAVGVLFFRFTHIKTYEAIFREAGLNFMVHRGKGFYRCEEVMEITQLLNYIYDARQRISLLSVLRSPIFGVTDPEVFDLFYGGEATIERFLESGNAYIRHTGETLKNWHFLSNRLTIAELIRTIIRDRALTAIYSLHPNGRQRAANIEKLIETARRFQSEGNGALPEFVEYCLRMADEEEEEGEASIITGEDCPIMLMTVHAAKGLEFPMVIVPDLDYRPPDRVSPGLPLRVYPSETGEPNQWNSEEGSMPVWPVEIPELGHVKKYSPLGYMLDRRNSLEAIAENRRVFYVACTRAMNHIVLIGSMKKKFQERNAGHLSSGDYKGRATILDILDDIYGFYRNFPPENDCCYPEKTGTPAVSWRDPGPRGFKGIDYKDDYFLPGDFGRYDDGIAKMDLSDPIIAPPYFQISFKSLKLFRECPKKFYYNVILGIRVEEQGHSWKATKIEDGSETWKTEDDETDLSGNALILGLLVHHYLERHHFGEEFSKEIFEDLWEKQLAYSHSNGDYDKSSLEYIRDKAIAQLERTINDECLIKALSRTSDYPEKSFLINIYRGVDFRGVIDRIFRDRDKGCWSIIDWKSNDLRGRNPKETAEQSDYFLQLECYKYAVEHISGERVDGLYIYFTDTGDLVESDLRLDAGDFIKVVSGKIAEYSGKNQPQVDMDCKKIETSRCRLCGYREAFCKVRQIRD